MTFLGKTIFQVFFQFSIPSMNPEVCLIHSTNNLESCCLEICLLISPAIGDEELDFALAPDVTGTLKILVPSAPDTESAQHPIFLVVHCWCKDGVGRIDLGEDLRKGSPI